MSNLEVRIKYMIQDVDRETEAGVYGPYYPDDVTIYDNSDVIPLIDGDTYFEDFYNEIGNLQAERLNGVNATEQGIYLANWVFEESFTFPNGASLIDLLKDEAIAGVDVKILVWVNDYALDTQQDSFFLGGDLADWPKDNMLFVNVQSLKTFINLTQTPELEENVMLNTLDYPAGGCHMKFAVVFGQNLAIGYTGGIDFKNNRKSDGSHIAKENGDLNNWHDVQAKIRGEAFAPLFDYYKSIWNELIDKYKTNIPQFLFQGDKYPSVQKLGSEINALGTDLIVPAVNNHSIQSLRTVPNQQYKYSMFTPINEEVISFAPSGIYEIQLAVKKAIENAELYIYIEDQAVVSREILGYLRLAIEQNTALKIIILTSNFDASGLRNSSRGALSQYLLKGLTDGQKEQVAIFSHALAKVHSKVYIIDDKFTIIGSAGMYNRALFVEWEHAISFIDSENPLYSVKDFRVDLWAEHFKVSGNLNGEKDQIRDLDAALNLWKNTWGVDSTSFKLPGYVEEMTGHDLVTAEKSFEGSPYPASLIPIRIFALNQFGEGVPYDSPDAVEWDYINDAAQLNGGGLDSIEDDGFPTDWQFKLTDYWVLILNGPNTGECLQIMDHLEHVIYVKEMPTEFDSTNWYVILKPYLKAQTIKEYILETITIDFKFHKFFDVGYLPPLSDESITDGGDTGGSLYTGDTGNN